MIKAWWQAVAETLYEPIMGWFTDAYMRYLVSLRRMNNIDVGGMATQGANNAKFAE